MNSFDDILKAYAKQVDLPWRDDTPSAGRVWIAWYDKSLQRRFTGRIAEFEHATLKAGHGWGQLNLSSWFGEWISKHEYFEGLIEQPAELPGLFPDIEDDLASSVRGALGDCSPNDVLAVDGCGSLFGVASVSTLLSRVATAIPGRLLIGFPGKHSNGIYRLLDARDGWNYHAIPVPPEHAF